MYSCCLPFLVAEWNSDLAAFSTGVDFEDFSIVADSSLFVESKMYPNPELNEYVTAEHALKYLARIDGIPHRAEGDGVLLTYIPRTAKRILDLGTGDGRLLSLLLIDRPDVEAVALDFSPAMLDAARRRFATSSKVRVVDHNLDHPLPDLGRFDVVVSGFAIHHCEDHRKKTIYAEIVRMLEPGGIFCNLEHVASATPDLHQRFLDALGITAADEDPSNKLVSVEMQLGWLREIGFANVDCYWKWMELALIGGAKPHKA